MEKRHSVAFIYCSLHGGFVAIYNLVRKLQSIIVDKNDTVSSGAIKIMTSKIISF